ncbi:hypothetical protein [Cyclobacterium jeungdonense]|uniref:Uncharacterized protein n=1 Tax=Cyclobacterium jeungdonense TaxID=708087 RepID=A0ABT8C798_9BACT|nr:hypothetical protein [Cyclobacterium jeungdonense]MDN3688012.1 hypothetical protein [Cyclobacterium jeungdonense]
MKFFRKIVPLVSYGLLVLVILMLVNSVVFYHEHALESGETIRHAHPFLSEEEEQNRDHSENEIILLDMVTHVQYFLPDVLGFVSGIQAVYEVPRPFLLAESPGIQFREILSLRGPPCSFFIRMPKS